MMRVATQKQVGESMLDDPFLQTIKMLEVYCSVGKKFWLLSLWNTGQKMRIEGGKVEEKSYLNEAQSKAS